MGGVTPLMLAAEGLGPEIVQLLINEGAAIDARSDKGEAALMRAAILNHDADVTYVLIEAGANVNITNQDGTTPLMYAANRNPNPDVIKYLVRAGADVNHHDNEYGKTALMIAAWSNPNPEIVRLLIDLGTDIHAKNAEGKTAVGYADYDDTNLQRNNEVKSIIWEAIFTEALRQKMKQ